MKLFVIILSLLFNAGYASAYAVEKPEVNLIALSDIHFDPFTSCKLQKPCPFILKLKNTTVEQWPKLFAQYDIDPPEYRQDTNYSLLVSTLTELNHAANSHQVQFVLILGDSLGHHFRQNYKLYSGDKTRIGYVNFVHKTLAFLTKALANTFPTTDVYIVAGNNDSYQGDYYTSVKSDFFRDTASLWSSLIRSHNAKLAMEAQFKNAGYYALTLPSAPNLRLIVLNTNLFSYKARGKYLDIAAKDQLQWLHQELKSAQEKKQEVFIAMHIPVGIDIYATSRFKLFTLLNLWKTNDIKVFQADIDAFAPQIKGIFFGHLHSDSFRIMTRKTAEIAMIGVPSISPIFGNNPEFKIYSYSLTLHQLKDDMTYSFALNKKSTWDMDYSFNRLYENNCERCSRLDCVSKRKSIMALRGTLCHLGERLQQPSPRS